MSDIFDERNMMQSLGKYVPDEADTKGKCYCD